MRFHVITRPQARLYLPGQYAAAAVDLSGVDWEQEFALVADMGEQRTGGYAVAARGVQVAGGAARVQLEVHRPGPGSIVTQAFSHPWALVRIPRTGLPPEAHVDVQDQHGQTLAALQVQLEGP